MSGPYRKPQSNDCNNKASDADTGGNDRCPQCAPLNAYVFAALLCKPVFNVASKQVTGGFEALNRSTWCYAHI
jgi:hypothetical protein